MKNHRRRLLSLLLAALMLLSSLLYALPVMASPGVPMNDVTLLPAPLPGEGETLVSGYAENKLQFDSAKRSITYVGGWSIGYLSATGYQHFTHVNSSSNTWLTKDTGDQWQSPAGTVERGSMNMRAAGGVGYATVIGFTAPLSGSVSFSLDSYKPVAGDSFAVFVGKRMAFPTAGIDFAAAEDKALWYTITAETDAAALNRALDAVLAVVEEGETISFAFRTGGGGGYSVAYPRVTYRTMSAKAISTSRINFQGVNFPTYAGSSGTYSLRDNLGGGWSLGSYTRDFTVERAHFSQIDATFCILNNGGTDQWSYGGLYLQNGVLITATGTVTAFTYEAPATGRANIRVGNITATKSSDGQDILFCILYNGKMIWPAVGGSLTNYDHWYNLTAEGASVSGDSMLSSSLQDVRLYTGDRVQYCFVARTGHSMSTKDIDLSVAYTFIDSSMPKVDAIGTSLAENYPVLRAPAEGGGLLAWRGRWQYATAPQGTTDYALLKNSDAAGNLLPGTEKSEGYVATAYQGGAAAGLCPGSLYDTAILYTARYSGSVTLSLGITDTSSAERYTVQLYQNGASTPYMATGTAAELTGTVFPFGLKGGDVIAIHLSRPEGESGSAPLFMAPTLSYRSLDDKIAITGASMALSSDLGVRFYTAAAVSYIESIGNGLLLWREGQTREDAIDLQTEPNDNNTCTYSYTDLSPKEMGDTLYLCPYLIMADGTRVEGEVTRFSIFDYATALYGENSLRNRMLTDMLNFGAAAQTYFAYRTGEPVTDRLSDAQLACGTTGGQLFTGCKSLSEADESTILTHIEAISLVLDGGISFRIYGNADYDEKEETSLFLELSTTPDFKNATAIRMKKAVCQTGVIPVGNVGRTYYMRLRTAAYGRNRYSQTLTYSVESYIANTSVAADTLQITLNEALLAYGNSARAYAYERELAERGL